MCTITTEAWEEIHNPESSCGENSGVYGLNDPSCVRELIQPLENIYNSTFADPYPDNNLTTSWYYYTGFHENNPWTYGSYTNSKVNAKASDLEELNRPLQYLGENITHFGGSASCRRHA